MKTTKYFLLVITIIIFSFSLFSVSQMELFDLYQKYKSGNLSSDDLQKIEELKKQYMDGGGSLSLEGDKVRETLPEEKDTKKDEKKADSQKGLPLDVGTILQVLQNRNFLGSSGSQKNIKPKTSYYYQNYYFNKKKTKYAIDVSSLKRYGYEIFESPSTYAPVENISVSGDYIIGPGDKLIINIWGGVNNEYEVTVDKNGNIAAPDFGTIAVAGLTYQEMKTKLNRMISSGSEINVAISELKTVRIFVTGDSESPGTYKLSGQANIVNAIFASGGPSKTGSMRSIYIKRRGKTITKFDLYDFLLNGDSGNDTYLMPGDVVFIPPAEDLVAIGGNVKRPSIYEMKKNETLSDLIKIAGGLTASADETNIFIERFKKDSERIIINVNGNEKKKISNFDLCDGDIIKIYPIIKNDKNAITLQGYTSTPRKYSYKEGLKISNIVKVENLLPDTYLKYAALKRKVYPENYYKTIPINLYKAIFINDEEYNIELKPEDKIILYSKKEMEKKPPVFIAGEVNKPGKFEYEEGMTILDLIHKSGGLTNLANKNTAEFVRINIGDDSVDSLLIKNINIRDVFEKPNNKEINLALEPFDKLFIRRIANFEENRSIRLQGEITYPGVYYAKEDEKLYDILKRAGGFTEEAYLRGAYFSRKSIKKRQEKRLDDLVDSLEKNLEAIISRAQESPQLNAVIPIYEKRIKKLKNSKPSGRLVINLPQKIKNLKDSPYNIKIKDGDILQIPKKDNSIIVLGNVYSQGVFVYENDKKTVGDYLDMAGGATKQGDLNQAFVIKANGRIISNHYIDEESKSFALFGSRFLNAKIFPGDTIIVPPKQVKEKFVSQLKDWTTVLYQLATTVKITSDVWND
ncbi:MAG TPA: SLBB domain-containing protein [Candidatus Mcinerneyibacterium sp.]|nr:SLBB domain-containing protein [Candidatus Mcinerneyibacterium sp.]